MMNEWWLAAIFLPLFPFSAVFSLLFKKLRNAWLRSLVLLAWPQLGLIILNDTGNPLPSWVITWAAATSLLYAYRSLTVREVGHWLSFIAISSWSLLWLSLTSQPADTVSLYALGFSLPFTILALLGGELEKRFMAAYAGLHGGMARSLPRLAGLLVITILAIIATPVFPGFFTMILAVLAHLKTMPVMTAGIVITWLLWSWSGMRMIQGLVTGPDSTQTTSDLDTPVTLFYSAVLLGIAILGLYSAGGLI